MLRRVNRQRFRPSFGSTADWLIPEGSFHLHSVAFTAIGEADNYGLLLPEEVQLDLAGNVFD